MVVARFFQQGTEEHLAFCIETHLLFDNSNNDDGFKTFKQEVRIGTKDKEKNSLGETAQEKP